MPKVKMKPLFGQFNKNGIGGVGGKSLSIALTKNSKSMPGHGSSKPKPVSREKSEQVQHAQTPMSKRVINEGGYTGKGIPKLGRGATKSTKKTIKGYA